MKTKNSIQLIGYLGKDPEIKSFKDGNHMAVLRLATDEPVVKGAEITYKCTWHKVICWGESMVSVIRRNAMKGSHILVEGSIVYHTYTDKNGKTCRSAEIKATKFLNLDR